MEKACSGYEVFINHRGPDTKEKLASLLYEFLRSSGFQVFFDRDELQTGDRVWPAIKAAIVSSSVQIAIFSPTYAGSTWCLEELSLMLQQPSHTSTIIPLFCDVEPCDVKYQKGKYAEAFEQHKNNGRVREDEIEKWKKALREAAELKGHLFDTEKDTWGEFVGKIVDIVVNKVRREPLRVADHPVGLDKAAENFNNEIKEQLESSGDITIVGIAGLGGTGKTALATYLYNLNLKPTKFSRSSFCKLSRGEVTSLQKQLLTDLRGDRESPVWNTKEGERLLRRRLRGLSRVFIVLDDIDNQEQIDPLLQALTDVLGKGSLIVITSRDKGLLARYQVKWYNMKLLDEKDAGQLFCQHAFHMSEAPTRFAGMTRELVKMCGGYPFALTVLGAQLFGKRPGYWKQELKKLQENKFPIKIVEKIKAAYNSLEEEEAKAAFLHFASFFDEQDFHLVVRAHPECALLDSIETLGQKCLMEFQWVELEVSVHGQMTKIKYNDGGHEDFCIEHWLRPCVRREFMSEDCKIGMHKFVKDMAKQIASEERDHCESSTEIQNISLDYQISDWAHQLPQGTTAGGSLRRFIVVEDCIQEFPQLNFLKCFLKRLRKCEASKWPSGKEGGLFPLNGVLQSSLPLVNESSGDGNSHGSGFLEPPLLKRQKIEE